MQGGGLYCTVLYSRVVASKADAELLLVRLGIDGFHCGKRKVFLKYYHLDFLTQVIYLHIATQYIATQYLHNVYPQFYTDQYSKIVRVQAAARRYLARLRAQRERWHTARRRAGAAA